MTAESLPALIDKAGNRLLEAKSSAEVLEAKKIAEAALHYARVTKAANDTHADCIRIITRAEMRMANEIDKGQADGSLISAKGGKPSEDRGVSLGDIGVSSQRVSEWRDLRDAGEGAVETAISKALAEGRPPTKTEILQAAREIKGATTEQKKARRAERERALGAKQLALPDKKYGVILADPEWRFETRSTAGMDRSADNHYPTSRTEDIAARDVPSIAADDCVLFLWATVPMLPDALFVMREWGFQYKSSAVWVKDRIGNGYWFRNAHELLLVGTKGNVVPPAMGDQWESVIDEPVRAHSQKPEASYKLIEAYFPTVPRIELNARARRDGWDSWGNEV
jgi:N6-adenosine-specific RNA methylase IME4